MTDTSVNRAAAEPYVTTFDATVRTVEGEHVTLSETYFYPEGGGQPADRGTVAGVEVVDVEKRDGETVHTLAEPAPVTAGDTVEGHVDEAFRTYCQRAHTASHVVYGAGRELVDPTGYAGFDIGPDTVRLDFETSTTPDDVDPLAFQRLACEVVWESRDVEWYGMDVEDARADDDIVFNLGDDAAIDDTVRIVDVDGWDVSACGGTHVRNTVEIGPVTVFDVSNPGAGRLRVEFAVGPTAIERQVARTERASRAARALGASVEDLPEQVDRLREGRESLTAERDALRRRLLDERLAALAADTVERDGAAWLVGTVEAVGANAVADYLRETDASADVVVLVEAGDAPFVVVATRGDVDASDVVDDVTDEFGGGGGGSPTLAQAGGLAADGSEVVAALRDA